MIKLFGISEETTVFIGAVLLISIVIFGGIFYNNNEYEQVCAKSNATFIQTESSDRPWSCELKQYCYLADGKPYCNK